MPKIFSEVDRSASEMGHKDVSFTKGQFYIIAAASGTGKSSLFSYIFGERADYSGDIFFDDKNISTIKSAEWVDIRKNKLGFIFQGLRLFTDLTVYENIELKNKLTNFKSKQGIQQLLEQVGIAEKIDTKARFLSFGQQQRVAIVRSLCQPLDFLLMDEPFSHLDEQNVGLLASLITSELKQQGAGMLRTSLGTKYPFEYPAKLQL